jgi:exosortase E/protease (VPEID-CTERM system)
MCGPGSSIGFVKRLVLLLAIGSAELASYYHFTNGAGIMRHGASPQLQATLAVATAELRDCVFACAAAIVIFSWSTCSTLIKSAGFTPSSDSVCNRWTFVHIALSALLIGWASIDPRLVSSPTAAIVWNLGRLFLFTVALASALLALIPLRLWLRWYSSSRAGVLTGIAFGLAAWIVRFPVRSVWWSTDSATLYGSYLILGLLRQHPIIEPPQHLLGVPGFVVDIAPQCAGFEGVVLITLLMGLYFWLWRKELHFPHVLVLLPIGIIASWLLNLLRIATLITLGAYHPDFALEGFHSIAGWTLFNLIGIGLIAASNEFDIFRVDHRPLAPAVAYREPPVGAYLVPLIVTMVTRMITGPFPALFEQLYPVTVVVLGSVLFRYWREYRRFDWGVSWWPLEVGAIVFAFWVILLRFSTPVGDAGSAESLHSLAHGGQTFQIISLALCAVFIVPMVEELAFRGYLIRKLISADFELVEPGRFTWTSFLLSSVLFGVMYHRWIVGTLAGMAFAIALYRRGRLTDAIIAHATSNALILLFMLNRGSWSFFGVEMTL